MDKILLALLVAATGSLVLPAMRLVPVSIARRIWKAPSGVTPREIKKHTDEVPLAPKARGRRLEFRPLTTDEKKEFENSLQRHAQVRRVTAGILAPALRVITRRQSW